MKLSMQEVLHMPFDIERHKKTFVDYLEIVIDPSGTVEYAVPSHQEKLIQVTGKSMEELDRICPDDMFCRVTEWLCQETGYIAVWRDGYVGNANDAQKKTLQMLTSHHLYSGRI